MCFLISSNLGNSTNGEDSDNGHISSHFSGDLEQQYDTIQIGRMFRIDRTRESKSAQVEVYVALPSGDAYGGQTCVYRPIISSNGLKIQKSRDRSSSAMLELSFV